MAAEKGHTETVALLLDGPSGSEGVNIHTRNDFALRFAAKYGHTDTVKLLLDRGAYIPRNMNIQELPDAVRKIISSHLKSRK